MTEFMAEFWAQALPALAALLAAFVLWGVQRLAKKWGIEIKAEETAALRVAVRAAIGGAEEWAAQQLKLDRKVKPGGAAKLDYVRKRIRQQWPELLPADLDAIVHEELAATYGAGATGEVTFGSAFGSISIPADPPPDK